MRMFTFMYFVCLLIILEADIKLTNNKYEGIVVTITDKISENPDLLSKIQEWLIEASQKLYVASEFYVCLGQITIRIPYHWKYNENYTLVGESSVRNFHLKIDAENPQVGQNPYTWGLTGCGHEGQFIHFTPEVIMSGNNGSFGNLGTVFVHEWGHYKWGLYDEYPSLKDNKGNAVTFYADSGNWEPVRCTKDVEGLIFNYYTKQRCLLDPSGIPEANCTFVARAGLTAKSADASVMGHSYLPTIRHFCDNKENDTRTLHNKFAPNRHNVLCGGKSSWEVMRRHSDFTNNSAGSAFQNTMPIFNIVQATIYERLCLVIDVSGSMTNLIGPTRDAAAALIKYILPNNSFVGIVKFNGVATTLKEMTEIRSESDRDNLIKSLPLTAQGSTSIGAGLQKGFETLSRLQNARGSIIYLATDGEENTSPKIADIKPTLEQNGVIVHTLAVTQSADAQLESIARSTGGLSFFFSEKSQNSTALVDAFVEPFGSTNDPFLWITSKYVSLKANENFVKLFYIDGTVGRETLIQLTTENVNGINLTVTHLDAMFSVLGTTQDHGVIALKLPGKVQPGEYAVHIVSLTYPVSGTLRIQSKASVLGGDVLQMKAWTSSQIMNFTETMQFPIFGSLLKGSAPVTKARVTAFIENEHGQISVLILKDNAVGADAIADDGIYSGFILPNLITSNGRLSIKLTAEGFKSSVILPSTKSTGITDKKVLFGPQPIENFTRVALASAVIVTSYTILNLNGNYDVIPPSKILTLILVEANNKNNTFNLTWTAVGDDFDIGKASRYDFRISKNYSGLVENPNQQDTIPMKLVPKESGTDESFTFQLLNPEENATYFVAVRAVDDYNNTGEISNIVSVSVLNPASSWFESTTILSTTPGVQYFDNRQNMFLVGIIAGSCVLLAIIIVVNITCIILRRRRMNSTNVKNRDSGRV